MGPRTKHPGPAVRVQQGMPNDQPYLGSHVARHKPNKRNVVSNAWLIKCVGPRGMLENTLVVVMGEFGRTPYVLKQDDH